MKFSRANAPDIKKYFVGTFMKFPAFAGDIVHYVDRVTDSVITGKCYDNGELCPFEFYLWDDKNKTPEVEFILPVKSFFLHHDHPHYLYRIPARQHRKGVNMDNTAIQRLAHDGSWNNVGIDYDILTSYVSKKSWGKLEAEVTALSPRMACAGLFIFVDKTVVATRDPGNKTLTVKEKLFTPELVKLIKDNPGWTLVDIPAPVAKSRKKITEKYYVEDGNLFEVE